MQPAILTKIIIFVAICSLVPEAGATNRKCCIRLTYAYRVIQKESAILWEMIVCVILSKKVHMNMGPILNGYRDMVKRRYEPSCEHEQQLRNK
jgi:hypothetical protein